MKINAGITAAISTAWVFPRDELGTGLRQTAESLHNAFDKVTLGLHGVTTLLSSLHSK